MRYFYWHLLGSVAVGAAQGGAYRLDDTYVPRRVTAHFGTAPTGTPFRYDINVDGVSIFEPRPSIQDEVDSEENTFASVQLSRDSIVTLDVDDVGSKSTGRDLTVCLELEEA